MPANKAETMPTRNMPSKTPAPPIERNPPYFLIFLKFKMSAPKSVPRVPDIKAQIAGNWGNRIIAKIAEKIGGKKAGKEIPLPGTTLANNFETRTIKIVAMIIGFKLKSNSQLKNKK